MLGKGHKMKRSLVTIAMMIALATTASASVETGTVDLNFGFTWQTEDGISESGATYPDRDLLDMSFGIDYFVTNRISLGIAYGYRDEEVTSIYTRTETSWALRIKYYILKRERLLPYVGFAYKLYDAESKYGSAAATSTDDTGTTFMAGLRYAITQKNAAYLEYQLNSYGDKWPNHVDGGSRITLGLIHQLK
jgi:opacity protein-like surface antigen